MTNHILAASTVRPLSPLKGSLYYDTQNRTVQIFDGSGWLNFDNGILCSETEAVNMGILQIVTYFVNDGWGSHEDEFEYANPSTETILEALEKNPSVVQYIKGQDLTEDMIIDIIPKGQWLYAMLPDPWKDNKKITQLYKMTWEI